MAKSLLSLLRIFLGFFYPQTLFNYTVFHSIPNCCHEFFSPLSLPYKMALTLPSRWPSRCSQDGARNIISHITVAHHYQLHIISLAAHHLQMHIIISCILSLAAHYIISFTLYHTSWCSPSTSWSSSQYCCLLTIRSRV